ncbi:HipA domain-containing protein [Chitinophaga sedimenti]|uniref:HipA domain-containing protein n=1 Tax=Chitinophaga sedimenti TaxID=2033606 RepID=UPI0020035238|nr:HipA domain-containing protein [Chitinophaga sedimenti]MCK7556561.1 HipA domain-containing protein [Chitinophaga sedimenti]
MMIANRIFKIPTVENCLVLLNGHDLAYMCRRFDIISDTERLHTENLSQLLDRRRSNAWEQVSPTLSNYYDVAQLIRKNVSAPYPAAISFFRLAMFNYLFSNNNLNLSSFSIIKDYRSDHCLAPYYNLSCTALHAPENREGFTLFQGDNENRFRTTSGCLRPAAFFEFGKGIGLPTAIVDDLFVQMLSSADTRVRFFIDNSFLAPDCKYTYKVSYERKLEMWKKDLPGSVKQCLLR